MMYYRIYGKAVFPEGIAPGEGKGFSNLLLAARNGASQPVLRGTAIAGALRSAFDALEDVDSETERSDKWFGFGLDKGQTSSKDSLVYVADMALNTGLDGERSEYRTHNLLNRHTGSVVKGGLFSLEAYPPNTSGDFLIYIKGCGDVNEDKNFAIALENILGDSLYLGGNRNRGIGRMTFESLSFAEFDTSTQDGMARWLNVRYDDRNGQFGNCAGTSLQIKPISGALSINVQMQIPRGEDLVVGYGTSINNLQSEPQVAVKADGKVYWRIPGATFRGIFRGWMNRLAARDGKELVDTHDRWVSTKEIDGDKIGHAFVPKEQWDSCAKLGGKSITDPIMNLFGTLFRRGRIHFGDAYSVNVANEEKDTQLRKHVAVDRFSGGANDGALFENKVLVGGVKFSMQVSIEKPTADDKRWLLQTLKAMNLGVLSLGSSKASGLLEVTNMDEIEKTLTAEVV